MFDTFLITFGTLSKYPDNLLRYLRLFTTSSFIIKMRERSPSFFNLTRLSCNESLPLPISITCIFKAFLRPSSLVRSSLTPALAALSIILTLVFSFRQRVISFARYLNKAPVSSFTPIIRIWIFLIFSLIFSKEIPSSIRESPSILPFKPLSTHLSDISILIVKSVWSK